MSVRDAIGALITAVGIAILGVGYKVLGGMWPWFGVGGVALGCGILALSARAHYIEKRLREYRGPGDWGQRDYSGGASAADSFGGGDGGGGDGGGGK
jgi:hypothetical protein